MQKAKKAVFGFGRPRCGLNPHNGLASTENRYEGAVQCKK